MLEKNCNTFNWKCFLKFQSTNGQTDKCSSLTEKPVDEFSVFSEYIANEFRQLQFEESKFLLKRSIQRAILDVVAFEEHLPHVNTENEEITVKEELWTWRRWRYLNVK